MTGLSGLLVVPCERLFGAGYGVPAGWETAWALAVAVLATHILVVELEIEADGEDAVVRVSDNGPGIEDHVLDRIFDPFVTTKEEGEGTGLGLAISRKLALEAR